MQMDLTVFDTEELFHLAIKLTGQQKHAQALACLKRAAKLAPHNGAVAYFTGVVYAQINLYERALAMMKHAVQLDPSLDIAHFQIGLLCFTSNRVSEAIEAWKPLDHLGSEQPLFLFKTGLEALAREDYAACREYLTRGIRLNTDNEPLNGDMRMVLQRIEGSQADAAGEPTTPAAGGDEPLRRSGEEPSGAQAPRTVQ